MSHTLPWTELERVLVRTECWHAGAPSRSELGPCPRESSNAWKMSAFHDMLGLVLTTF